MICIHLKLSCTCQFASLPGMVSSTTLSAVKSSAHLTKQPFLLPQWEHILAHHNISSTPVVSPKQQMKAAKREHYPALIHHLGFLEFMSSLILFCVCFMESISFVPLVKTLQTRASIPVSAVIPTGHKIPFTCRLLLMNQIYSSKTKMKRISLG